MVTHDIGLKNYATKVVRMLDGKIHKIEENSVENRREHLHALRQVVDEYKEIEQAKNNGVNQDNLGVREGKTIFLKGFNKNFFKVRKREMKSRIIIKILNLMKSRLSLNSNLESLLIMQRLLFQKENSK